MTGKVQAIAYDGTTDIQSIRFEYDAMGNRIEKKAVYSNSNENKITYYVHDAQGNCMAVYTRYQKDLTLEERYIYGSSRVGAEYPNDVLASVEDSLNIHVEYFEKQRVGDKRYELSNHLGNVLEVITDRKLAEDNGLGGVDFYTADVVSYSDYYPFGMMLPGRNGGTSEYDYGFQGQLEDDEIKGDGNSVNFKYRMHDTRIGRFFAVDSDTYVYAFLSPYSYAGNSPIMYTDVEGRGPLPLVSVEYLVGNLTASISVATGIGIIKEGGTAWDSYGTTRFTKTTTICFDMDLSEGASNPNVSFGAEIGASAVWVLDWTDDSFYGGQQADDVSVSIGLEAGLGIKIGADEDGLTLSFSAGPSVGLNLEIGSTSSKIYSISVTDSEANTLDEIDATSVSDSETWKVTNITNVYDERGNKIGEQGTVMVTNGASNASFWSEVTVYSSGNGMWVSQQYVNNALEDPDLEGSEKVFFNQANNIIQNALKPVAKTSGSSSANSGGAVSNN